MSIDKPIKKYHDTLLSYRGLDVFNEQGLRSAMFDLLTEAGKEAGWTLIAEQAHGRNRPDGTFRDKFNLIRGYWEAKDSKDDLDNEIRKKIALGYPLSNMLFEDTSRAVLFQGKDHKYEYDLTKPDNLRDMIKQIISYSAPDIDSFHKAIDEFKAKIPQLAEGLMKRIETEQTLNPRFIQAFEDFHEVCRSSLDPAISAKTIEEMLVQHILTERLFRTIFNNPDFTQRNVIAQEIEKVIQALTSREFNRNEFLKTLDRFYVAIELAAQSITDWSEKQKFLNTVYERFFQGFSAKQADTMGIVYTPQEIVSYMCSSVEHILKTEFNSSLSTPGVKILDPATGTGNFIVHILRNFINGRDLKQKYQEDLFANEIMLLPYYIASLNIEHEYYEKSKEYLPFEGLCFADTLNLEERQSKMVFSEENTDRMQREREAKITVIIGNPPYNVGQKNENDNNKNRAYKTIDNRIKESYARDSKATLNTKLYDAYVKFFRWATDRLKDRDGIVCFVSNNGFLKGVAFDGFRKHLSKDFTEIYHLNCKGNARTSGERRRAESGNIFHDQIRTGIGITILVRRRNNIEFLEDSKATVYYYELEDYMKSEAKLKQISDFVNIENINWEILTPNKRFDWLNHGMQDDFEQHLLIGTRLYKAIEKEPTAIFNTYSLGISTNRDMQVYDFNKDHLVTKINLFIDNFNSEANRWLVSKPGDTIDQFVNYSEIKWSRNLKRDLKNKTHLIFKSENIQPSMYRPYSKRLVYFSKTIIDELGSIRKYFPVSQINNENIALCMTAVGNSKTFQSLAINCKPDLHLTGDTQCFPFYTYNEDGTDRKENITDWALKQFQEAHGDKVNKWNIFHYTYALLHDPNYREKYIENLKRELPRLPLQWGDNPNTFFHFADIGEKLMNLHLNYETAEEYPLTWLENKDIPFSWRVDKMRLSKDKTELKVNESLTLAGIPPEAFEYRLGNRSALDWVIDQYQVSTDKRSGLVSDPNRSDDEQYIVRLVGRVITVSLETVALVNSLLEN